MDAVNLMWAILIGLLVPVTLMVWVLCAVVLKGAIKAWNEKP